VFAAFILVCSLSSNSDCVEVLDTRGPYRTVEACEARVVEMVRDVALFIPQPYKTKYKCEHLTGI